MGNVFSTLLYFTQHPPRKVCFGERFLSSLLSLSVIFILSDLLVTSTPNAKSILDLYPHTRYALIVRMCTHFCPFRE